MDPLSLILAGVAIFFVYKLISVLGARTGHEQRQEIEGLQRAARPQEDDVAGDATPLRPGAERRAAAISAAAAPLREADPEFDERAFLDGAKGAYEMIVEAFAAGDLKSVKKFLAASVLEAFRKALSDRDTAGARVDLKFVGIEEAAVKSSRVDDGAMVAVVNFASNQVRTTYDREGNVIDGDPNRVDLVREAWTFSRKIASSDPNWTLVATSASA